MREPFSMSRDVRCRESRWTRERGRGRARKKGIYRFIHPRWARNVEENADTCARGFASSKYRKVNVTVRTVRRAYGPDIPKLRAFVLLPVRRAATFSMKTALPSYRGAQPRTGAAARIAHTRDCDTCAPDGSECRAALTFKGEAEHRQTTYSLHCFAERNSFSHRLRQLRSSLCAGLNNLLVVRYLAYDIHAPQW